MNQYGINIDTLEQFIERPRAVTHPWGKETVLFSREEFGLRKIEAETGNEFVFDTGEHELTVFVESGAVEINNQPLVAQGVFYVAPKTHVRAMSKISSTLYFFEGPYATAYGAAYGVPQNTTDVREKYWGRIETITSRQYAAKRIVCNKDKHSSLEYHCKKIEGYYVHSGVLLVRLRAGRGEDRIFELGAGTTIFIPPGLMHQRGGRKDAVVIEISTKDDDADSFLVEDGQKMPMPELLLS